MMRRKGAALGVAGLADCLKAVSTPLENKAAVLLGERCQPRVAGSPPAPGPTEKEEKVYGSS